MIEGGVEEKRVKQEGHQGKDGDIPLPVLGEASCHKHCPPGFVYRQCH
jgi:hypothetical protein